MTLRTIAPRLQQARQSKLPKPTKKTDSYYLSPEWKALRAACLNRDEHRCSEPGCNSRAIIADHITSRRNGGADTLDNLRSLCRAHDNRKKENWDGTRRSGG